MNSNNSSYPTNLLFLAHRIPYPPNKGDKIRSFNEIKHLSSSHSIDLICIADDPVDLKYEEDLKKYCKKVKVFPLNTLNAKFNGLISFINGGSISEGYFYLPSMQQAVDKWLAENNYDAIICFSSPMAEYIFRSKTLYSQPCSPCLLMDFCDVDSDKWLQYSQPANFPLNLIFRTESKRLLKYEEKVNEKFHHSIFVSEKEAELFKNLSPKAKNITVIPNGVDQNYFNPNPSNPQPNELNKTGYYYIVMVSKLFDFTCRVAAHYIENQTWIIGDYFWEYFVTEPQDPVNVGVVVHGAGKH